MDQRVRLEGLCEVPQRLVIYARKRDPNLSFTNWLFAGHGRVGIIRPEELSEEMKDLLRRSTQVQIVDADVDGYTLSGHSNFYKHPAVSSDLILVLRGEHDPDPNGGRPMSRDADGFWRLDDGYLGFAPP